MTCCDFSTDQIESIRYLQYDELANVVLPLLNRSGLAPINLLPIDFFERYTAISSIKMWTRAKNTFKAACERLSKVERRLYVTNS